MNPILNLKKSFIISAALHTIFFICSTLLISGSKLPGDRNGEQALAVALLIRHFSPPGKMLQPKSKTKTSRKKININDKQALLKNSDEKTKKVQLAKNNILKKDFFNKAIKRNSGKKSIKTATLTISKTKVDSKEETDSYGLFLSTKPEMQNSPGKAEFSGADFTSIIKAKIDAAKRYPKLAVRRGLEGSAIIKFRVRRDGEVDEINLVKSSGFGILDRASMKAVKRAAPFPYFGVWLKVAVSFKLT